MENSVKSQPANPPHSHSLLKQSEILQRKFKFSEKELLLIKKRFFSIFFDFLKFPLINPVFSKSFAKISKNGLLTAENFRDSLGLLGLEPASFLSDRIFAAIDENCDKIVDFSDFLRYLNIMINGTEKEKALLSFRIIDKEKKERISYKDIEDMIIGISCLWNALTDAEVVPKKDYIDHIYKTFDFHKTGEISFNE